MDGVIWGYLYHCRPLAQTPHIVKKWVEENTGIPTVSLEMDIYDSRNYSVGVMRTGEEAFAGMLRARRASART